MTELEKLTNLVNETFNRCTSEYELLALRENFLVEVDKIFTKKLIKINQENADIYKDLME